MKTTSSNSSTSDGTKQVDFDPGFEISNKNSHVS